MRDLLTNQIIGLNGLANLSNLGFLFAFSVQDVLKLRVLSVVSYCVILPYYYLQTETLWPPLFWGLAFIVVNAVRIAILIAERRPVVLSEKEEELYRLAFNSIDKRDFLRLASLVQWMDCSAGEVILRKGQQSSDAIVLISGVIEAVLDDKTIFQFRPGQIIGNAFSGLVSPADVVARGPARLAKWDREHLIEFTDRRPELRARLLEIGKSDLAAKIREFACVQFRSH
jgi:hypothetical protein